jgi:indole-3-glycerol phosphate synthase
MSILDRIFADKRVEVADQERRAPLESVIRAAGLAPVPPGFERVFRERTPGRPAVIAEIKSRSPSKGPLNPDLDPARTARTYRDCGAAAISVLTDTHYFGGSLEDLRRAAAEVDLPILRKDFVFSPYQVYEARAAGASAVLLIVGMLDSAVLADLVALSRRLDLAALVEVHDRAELDRALAAGAGLLGINNRDLHSFEVRLETTFELHPHVPPGIPVIAESGIRTRADIDRLAAAGVDGVLIGEALVTAADPGGLLSELAGADDG